MRVDLTINLPLLLTLVVTIWGAAAAVSGRFSRLEERLASLMQTVTDHTEQEEKRFDQLGERLRRQSGDIQSLRVGQARVETRQNALESYRSKEWTS